jgi:hypothetical protein
VDPQGANLSYLLIPDGDGDGDGDGDIIFVFEAARLVALNEYAETTAASSPSSRRPLPRGGLPHRA